MIIVNPDDIISLCNFYDLTAEYLIHFHVRIPVLSVVDRVLGKIVEQRPDCSIAETVIIIFHVVLFYKNRVALVLP